MAQHAESECLPGNWLSARGRGSLPPPPVRNLPFLVRLGANQVIDHNATRFEDTVHNTDVVLDLVGGETQDRSWKVLKTGGAPRLDCFDAIAGKGHALRSARMEDADAHACRRIDLARRLDRQWRD